MGNWTFRFLPENIAISERSPHPEAQVQEGKEALPEIGKPSLERKEVKPSRDVLLSEVRVVPQDSLQL